MKVLVLENNNYAIESVMNWVKNKREAFKSNVEFDEILSQKIDVLNWKERFESIRTLDGEYLIILDLNYNFPDEVQKNIIEVYNIKLNPNDYPRLFDGLALANILIRDSNVKRTLVIVATSEGASGKYAEELNSIVADNGKSQNIKFWHSSVANGLSGSSKERIVELLDDAAKVYAKEYGDRREAKSKVLKSAQFGYGVTEEEKEWLDQIFVETELWEQILQDSKDIVIGGKGSGKSAIYENLIQKTTELKKQKILLCTGENNRVDSVFNSWSKLENTPQGNFELAWKLIILKLAATTLDNNKIKDLRLFNILYLLQEWKLIPTSKSIGGKIYRGIKRILGFISLPKVDVSIDPQTYQPTGFSITPNITNATDKDHPFTFLDDYIQEINEILGSQNKKLWIAFDRLDEAFDHSAKVEKNAIGGLLSVYKNLRQFNNIKLKLFLRSDVWRIVSDNGFRGMSHFVRNGDITWDRASLLNLIVKRLTFNQGICTFYDVEKNRLLENIQEQKRFFETVFPKQIDKTELFEWMWANFQDGNGIVFPREVIQWLSYAREGQIKRFEQGHFEAPNLQMFDEFVLKEAFAKVANTRLEMTLLPEYPEIKDWVLALGGGPPSYTIDNLATKWNMTIENATKIAKRLKDIGFLAHENDAYKIPRLYGEALRVQYF